jgi:hypothetical protein
MKVLLNRFTLIPLLCMLVVACGVLGIPKPENFSEKLASGYTTVTGVRNTAATLLTAEKIGSADAQNIQDGADNARAGLDIARTLQGTDPTAAQNRLTATLTVLTALEAYLATKGN